MKERMARPPRRTAGGRPAACLAVCLALGAAVLVAWAAAAAAPGAPLAHPAPDAAWPAGSWVQEAAAQSDTTAFVTTWQTTAPGETIRLPVDGSDMTVDWGDGTMDTGLSGWKTHTYDVAGNHTVSVSGGLERINPAVLTDPHKLVSIDQWGDIRWTSMNSAFDGATNMVYRATDAPDLSGVTDMSFMFHLASSFNGNISGWNVSSVTDMSGMFQHATSFNQPLDGWDVSRVTLMISMFQDARSFNQPLNGWNVSSVTNMNHMFRDVPRFNQHLDSWDVSKVVHMNSMFRGAASFNGNVSGWDVGRVTDMSRMFQENPEIGDSAFNQPLDSWNVSSVSDMSYMFWGASFNRPLNSWNVSKVTTMHNMFSGATSFNQPLNDWDVSKVTAMNSMFINSAFNQPLDSWNVSRVTNMHNMFASTFFNQSLDSWDVSKVTDMSSMFHRASNFNQPLDSWDVSRVADMSSMFDRASNFNQPLNGWDVSKVTDMNHMFKAAASFNQPLDSWDVSSVTSMANMFESASNFNGNISSWNVSKVDNMRVMFAEASSFDQPLNDWDVSKVTDMFEVFSIAQSFNQPLNDWDVSSVTNMEAMFNGAQSFNQPLDSWDVSRVTFAGSMFRGATSFNQPLDSWDVSMMVDMPNMFQGATNFSQNLGKWYVVAPDGAVLVLPHGSGVQVRTQNTFLDDQSPVYATDTAGFEFDGSVLRAGRDNPPESGVHRVTVTVGGPGVFGTGNSHDIDVSVVRAFVTTWRTTGTNETITIPLTGSNMTISWGDGSDVETGLSGPQSHMYATAGNHTISVSGGLERLNMDRHPDAPKLRSMDQWGDTRWTSMAYTFSNAYNMVYNADDAPDLSRVTDMTSMFSNADSFNGDISGWDVSTVKNMQHMFQYTDSFNQPLDSWNVSSVTDMRSMFEGTKSFDRPLNDWDVSRLYHTHSMFFLSESFNQSLDSWDVSRVGNMGGMFEFSSYTRNLGPWLVVIDNPTVSSAPGGAMAVRAQNPQLHGWISGYAVNDARFVMDGNLLSVNSTANVRDGAYNVTITAGMLSALGAANHSRTVEITVTSDDPSAVTDPPYPQFSTSSLNATSGELAITFSKTVDSGTVKPALFRVAESDNHTRGATLTAGELQDAAGNSTVVRFDLTAAHLERVLELDAPVLIIEPGAVTDTDGNPKVGSYDVSTASYAGSSAVRDSDPGGLDFSSDGTRMFAVGRGGDAVYAYNLTAPYDVSTLAFADSLPLDAPIRDPTDVAFSSDGTKMFVISLRQGSIIEYSLDSPFDISGADFVDSLFLTSWDDALSGLDLSPDGTRLFVVDTEINAVRECRLAAPFDLSGASCSKFFPPTQVPDPYSVDFSPDGSRMLVLDTRFGGVYEYHLDVPFDVSLARFVHHTDEAPAGRTYGMEFSPDGFRMFILDGGAVAVLEFNLTSVYPVEMVSGAGGGPRPFTTTWETDSAGETVTIPLAGFGVEVDWGDGTVETSLSTGQHSHTYDAAGNHTVSISGGLKRIILGDLASEDAQKMRSIDQWGDVRWTSMHLAFEGATDMTYNAPDTPDLSGVTDMYSMFSHTSFNGNVSGWDVSRVTNMSRLFHINQVFNQPLNDWNVSSVTDMSQMFTFASSFDHPLDSWDVSSVTDMYNVFVLATSFDQPLDSWDVSRVTNMQGMFSDASSFNQPLDSWDVSRVTNMQGMFQSARSFNQDISGWDVSKVTDMNEMFNAASSFNQPLNGWNVSKVTDMSHMFEAASNFNQPLNDWNVSGVTDMSNMFQTADAFSQNLGKWYIVLDDDDGSGTPPQGHVFRIRAQNAFLDAQMPEYATDAAGFAFAGSVLHTDADSPPASRVHRVTVTAGGPGVFGSGNSHTVDVSVVRPFVTTWETTAANEDILIPLTGSDMAITWGDGTADTGLSTGQHTHAYGTAGNHTVSISGGLERITMGGLDFTSALRSIDQWGDTRWTSMNSAFEDTLITYNAADAPDLSRVTDMTGMFRASLFDGDVSDWNVSKVTDMTRMFRGAVSFNQSLNSWDVSSVKSMTGMFSQADSFNQPLDKWNVSSVTDMQSMFERASSFNQPLDSWDVSRVIYMRGMFDNAASFDQPLDSWDVSRVSSMDRMLDDTTYTRNLGPWLVVIDSPTVSSAPGAAAVPVRAQSPLLDSWISGYAVNDARFVMDGNLLSVNSSESVPDGDYDVTITAGMITHLGAASHNRTVGITVNSLPATAFVTTWRTDSANQTITINLVGSNMTVSWGDGQADGGVSGTVSHTYADPGDYTVGVTGGLTGLTLDLLLGIHGAPGGAPELVSIDQWGDARWTNMSHAFAGAYNMVYNAADAPDLSRVTDMSGMFINADSFNGDISGWDVSAVTDMSDMFAQTNSFDQPLDSWDVSKVTDMSDMFLDADFFNQPLDSWNVSRVTNMEFMFNDARSFNQPLDSWDVSSVSNMGAMFTSALSFNQPLDSWDVSKVTDMSGMFNDARSFNQPLDSWDVSSAIYMGDMFVGAANFSQNLGKWFVVLDGQTISAPGGKLAIRAQNAFLDTYQAPYTVDDPRFVLENRMLSINSTATVPADTYTLTITLGGAASVLWPRAPHPDRRRYGDLRPVRQRPAHSLGQRQPHDRRRGVHGGAHRRGLRPGRGRPHLFVEPGVPLQPRHNHRQPELGVRHL